MKTRQRFDEELKKAAVRIVAEPGKSIAPAACELGFSDGNGQLSANERRELTRLRWENAELTMERDALKRSVAFWVQEAMRR